MDPGIGFGFGLRAVPVGFVGRVAQVRRLPLLDVGVVSYPFNQNSDAAEYKWSLESQDAGLSYGRVACLLIQLVATTGRLRGMPRDLYRDVGAVWCLIKAASSSSTSRLHKSRSSRRMRAERIARDTYVSILDVGHACDATQTTPVWEERDVSLGAEIRALGELCLDPRRGGRADLTRLRAFPRGTVADLVETVRSHQTELAALRTRVGHVILA